MTSTSNKTIIITILLIITSTTAIALQHQTTAVNDQTGFEIPQYETQEEILYELVAPFIFVTTILFLGYSKVLHTIFKDEEQHAYMVPPMVYTDHGSAKPNVRKYAMLMSITTTSILIPTVFWTYIVWMIASIGVIAPTAFALIILYVLYMMIRN